jgi:UDP-N-acetylmuramate--alanine ligase
VICSEKFANRKIEKCVTNIPGVHNVSNALAAIAVGLKLSISTKDIINGIASYTGVKRRFTITGQECGITFIDDYAHHPEEIMATLSAARTVLSNTGGKLFVVFQPHKYSRLNSLFDRFVNSFSDADMLYIADVYAASEKPIDGINNKVLVKTIQDRRKHNDVSVLDSPSILPELIKSRCKENDIVMFMGAGDITQWAYEVPKKING